jgi:hypothetical protein
VAVRSLVIITGAVLAGCGSRQAAGPVPAPTSPITVTASGVPTNLPPGQQAAIAQEVAASQERANAYRDQAVARINAKQH